MALRVKKYLLPLLCEGEGSQGKKNIGLYMLSFKVELSVHIANCSRLLVGALAMFVAEVSDGFVGHEVANLSVLISYLNDLFHEQIFMNKSTVSGKFS